MAYKGRPDDGYNWAPMRSAQSKARGLHQGFHGTSKDIKDTHIRPQSHSDDRNFPISSGDHVNYVATDKTVKDESWIGAENEAWIWSEQGGLNSGGRPRVHAVTAEGVVGYDPNLTEPGNEGAERTVPMAAKSARIDDTIWTPPPSPNAAGAGRGVQGTLPHVNWNQFGLPNTGNPYDAEAGTTAFDTQWAYERDQEKSKARQQTRLDNMPGGANRSKVDPNQLELF